MPNTPSEQIRECLAHAEECVRQANAQTIQPSSKTSGQRGGAGWRSQEVTGPVSICPIALTCRCALDC